MRAARREAKRWVALLFTLALLAGIVSAGARYFYCPFMDAVVGEHCCTRDTPEPTSSVHRPDCCEVRYVGSLPAASSAAHAPELRAAPLLAVLAPAFDPELCAMTPAARPEVRSGLSPPPARRSAQRIVLRI